MPSLPDFLTQYKIWILAAHIFGASVGMGGVVITDVLFFRFLKDLRISRKEKEVMDTLSGAITVALTVILVTGVPLYLFSPETYNAKPAFLLKMLATLVLSLNGIGLHLYVGPKLRRLSFLPVASSRMRTINRLRRASFAMGAISVVSWLTAFGMALLKPVIHLPFGILWPLYVLAVCSAVSIGLWQEKRCADCGVLLRRK